MYFYTIANKVSRYPIDYCIGGIFGCEVYSDTQKPLSPCNAVDQSNGPSNVLSAIFFVIYIIYNLMHSATLNMHFRLEVILFDITHMQISVCFFSLPKMISITEPQTYILYVLCSTGTKPYLFIYLGLIFERSKLIERSISVFLCTDCRNETNCCCSITFFGNYVILGQWSCVQQ